MFLSFSDYNCKKLLALVVEVWNAETDKPKTEWFALLRRK